MDGRLGWSIANCKIGRIVPLVGLPRLVGKDLLDVIDTEICYETQDVLAETWNLHDLKSLTHLLLLV